MIVKFSSGLHVCNNLDDTYDQHVILWNIHEAGYYK